jgi:diguanylate cyclase (GGDEF)-like protein
MVASGARDMANLKFDTVVSARGQNEISQLALSFNDMRMQLKNAVEERNKTMQALQELNVSLEERVNQRTRELQTLNREVAYQAVHDPLTGLPNRLLITERLQYAVKQAHREKTSFAVLMVDLDNFKEVNDTLGHLVGDELLCQVAERLTSVLRETDTVGRLGGDEFALVLVNVDAHSAMNVADKIHRALLQNFQVDGHTLAASGSIGVALFPDHGKEYTTLLRRSDVAMYSAKRTNSKISLYDPENDRHSLQRLSLVTDLRLALEEHQLELHYQPIVELSAGRVVGVEALLRWNHPKYGPIAPTEFIPIAENSNLIKPLSDWVIRKAAADWHDWHTAGQELQVSINLSMINLLDPGLPEDIAQIREETQMPANAIKLEITESEIMSNPERVIKVMNHDHMSGIKYSVDDFGTGYSSLSYLKKLPVQEVKIDRSFVTSMAIDAEDASIVCAVVELAHSLGLNVVAEGVEDRDVMQQLIKLGCEYAQGYYFSRPLPADRLIEAIAQIETLYLDSASPGVQSKQTVTH